VWSFLYAAQDEKKTLMKGKK